MSRVLAATVVASAAHAVSAKGPALCVAQASQPSCTMGTVTVNLDPYSSTGYDTVAWSTSQKGAGVKGNQINFDASALTCNVQETATLSLKDADGAEVASCEVHYVFQPTDAPTFTAKSLPEDHTVEAGQLGVAETLTAKTGCNQDATVTYSEDTSALHKGVGRVVRTWTAADACGNESVHQQTITVGDTTPPDFHGVDLDITVPCNAVPPPCEPTATDASQQGDLVVSLKEERIQEECANSYTLVRTWTAADGHGQTATSTQTVTVVDNSPPTFTATPADSVSAVCDYVPDAPAVGATDNCDENVSVNFDTTRVDGGCAHTYDLVRTWTATDVCGNSATQQQTVAVEDSVPPVLSGVPADTTHSCDHVEPPCLVTASDNCDDFVTVAYNQVEISRKCEDEYTLVRTWSSQDACGNPVSEDQTIVVVDDQAPVLSVNSVTDGEVFTRTCEEFYPTYDATDNCAVVEAEFSTEKINVESPNHYDVIHSYSVVDNCGQTDSLSFTILVRDTTGPVLVNVPVDATVQCEEPAVPTVSATDNCCDATVSVTVDRIPGDCEHRLVSIRSWTSVDCNGNTDDVTSVGSQTVTVVDNTPPTCTPTPADVDDYGCTLPAAPSLTCTDNCDANVVAEFSEEVLEDGCPHIVQRSWYAADVCGNSFEHSHTLTHEDTTPPVLSPKPADDDVECDAVPDAPTVNWTDECNASGTADFSEVREDGSCDDEYELIRSWSATDACGLSATWTQTIRVTDTEAPSMPNFSYGDYGAEDNCDPNPTVDVSETTTPGCDESYTTVTEYIATDRCGNASPIKTETYSHQDTTPPTIDCTANCGDAYDCDDTALAPVLTASGASVGPTCTGPVATGNCGWSEVYTCTAEDECGNKVVETYTNTFVDSTAPSMTVPPDATIPCDENFPSTPAVPATDNCDTSVSHGSVVSEVETTEYPFTLTVTWTASDACGNSVTDSTTWTKEDTTPPAVTCPGDQTLECNENPSGNPSYDDCNTVTVEFSTTTTGGSCENAGTVVRTWSFVDAAGNANECSQTVTFDDTTPPVLTSNAPGDLELNCGEPYEPLSLSYTDNCDTLLDIEAHVKTHKEIGEPGGTDYMTVITYTAEDNCGNSVTHFQTITSQDTAPPTLTVPDDQTIQCDDNLTWGSVDYADDCSTPVVTFSDEKTTFDCSDSYKVVRTWTVVDAEGNAATDSATINVVDYDLDTGDDLIQISVSNIPAEEVYWVPGHTQHPGPTVTASHPCNNPEVTKTEIITPGCDESYTIVWNFEIKTDCQTWTRSYTQVVTDLYHYHPPPSDEAKDCADTHHSPAVCTGDACLTTCVVTSCGQDECGNQDCGTYDITYTDTTPPTITVNDQTFECDEDIEFQVSVADDCNALPSYNLAYTTKVDKDGNTQYCFYAGAVDACGNQADEVCVSATVVDNQAPTITAPADSTVAYDGDDTKTHTCDIADANISDNCDNSVTCDSYGSQDCEGGQFISTYTVIDAYGQSATDSTTITVLDNTAPKLQGVPPDATYTVEDHTKGLEEAIAGNSYLTFPWPSVTYDDDDAVDQNLKIQTTEKVINDDSVDGNAYIIIRTWSVQDNYGCGSDSDAQTITVTDDVPPLITGVPPNYYLDCAAVEADTIENKVDEVTAAVQDYIDNELNVADQDWSLTATSPSGPVTTKPKGPDCGDFISVYTWTVQDTAGNTISASMSVHVTDTSAPTITVNTNGVDVNQYCTLDAPEASADDNCLADANLSVTVSSNPDPIVDGAAYTQTWTWNADDGCGNAAQKGFSVTVTDTTPPVFTAGDNPDSFDSECGDEPVVNPPTADDECTEAELTGPVRSDESENCAQKLYTLTWTATDDHGNTATFSYDVVINKGPYTISWDGTLPGNVGPVEGCDFPNAPTAPTASANCGATATVTPSTNTVDGYTKTYTWTATVGSCYSPLSHTVTHSWQDTTPPVATVDDDTDECTARATETVTFTDACGDVKGEETRTEEGSCPTTITRTWTATDNNGNQGSTTATLIVDDTTPPFFTLGYTQVTQLDDVATSETCTSPNNWAVLAASDTCDTSVEVTSSDSGSHSGCDSTVTRTWTATDDCGNTATISQDRRVVDTTPPSFTATDGSYDCEDAAEQPRYVEYDCNGIATREVSQVTEDATKGDCPTQVRFTTTLTDNCGNSASFDQIAQMVDNEDPVFDAHSDVVTQDCTEPSHSAPTASDNCGDPDVVQTDRSVLTAECDGSSVEYEYTATDSCGNTATTYITVSWGDVEAPDLPDSLPDLHDECAKDDSKWDSPKASDNCSTDIIPTYKDSVVSSEACNQEYQRTWTATDSCGHTDTVTQTYTVSDNTPPVWGSSKEKYQTQDCSNFTPTPPTASDNCDPDPLTVTHDPDVVLVAEDDCTEPHILYKYARTYRAADACGNNISWTATITITDDEAPTVNMLCNGGPCEDTTFESECQSAPVVTCTAYDNCGQPTPAFAQSETHYCGGERVETVTYSCGATFHCLSAQTETVTFTFVDTTPPVITPVNDLTKQCSASPSTPTAAETCGGDAVAVSTTVETVSQSELSGCRDTVQVYTYTAVDCAGNAAEAKRTVTIEDTTDPTLTLFGGDTTAECDLDGHVWPKVSAEDNCDESNVSIDSTDEVENQTCGSIVTRTYTATDSCGNTDSEDHYVIVGDTTPPTWIGGGDDCREQCEECEDDTPKASDNCDGTITPTSTSAVDPNNSYITIVTWTATDDCGNTITKEQRLHVEDDTPPSITVDRSSVTVNCDEVPVLYDGIATGDDNCDVHSVVCEEEKLAGDCDYDYTLERTCTVTDTSGNTATSTHSVTVEDKTDPVLVGPTASARDFCDPHVPIEVTATDNCDGFVDVTQGKGVVSPGDCPSEYSVSTTYTASDSCGNTGTLTHVETITDSTPPTLSNTPDDETVECDSIPAPCVVTVLSDCRGGSEGSSAQFKEQKESVVNESDYTLRRTWTAVDACGNDVTHTQLIRVQDTTPPLLSRLPADETVSCDCDTLPGSVDIAAIDNCDASIEALATTVKSDAVGHGFTLTNTWTATDASGNSVTHVQVVTVQDVDAPIIAGGVPSTSTVQCDAIPNTETMYDALVRDNCDDDATIDYTEGAADYCNGSRDLEWTVSDATGNTQVYTQTQTITDIDAPVLVDAPGCISPKSTVLSSGAFAISDACDSAPTIVNISCNSTAATNLCSWGKGALDVTAGANSGAAFDVFVTAEDSCGNSADFKRTLIVNEGC